MPYTPLLFIGTISNSGRATVVVLLKIVKLEPHLRFRFTIYSSKHMFLLVRLVLLHYTSCKIHIILVIWETAIYSRLLLMMKRPTKVCQLLRVE